jgi:hypothetical protein
MGLEDLSKPPATHAPLGCDSGARVSRATPRAPKRPSPPTWVTTPLMV